MILRIKLSDFKNQYGIKNEIESIIIDNVTQEVIVVCKSFNNIK